MILDEKILECEFEYAKCFCEYFNNNDVIRFRDNELKDMYYHNYTYIKNKVRDIELERILHEEISLRLSEKSNFCNILLNFNIDSSMMNKLKYKGELSRYGYYSFDITQFSKLKAISDCIIKRVDSKEMIDDILFCDLTHDEESLGKGFCIRRCYRRGKVYISDNGVNSYVCYYNGEIIGNCDLFIYNNVAKIEDFAVIPIHQRKGYGTTILKTLINIAIKENCNTIYLNTDEEDTAKDMYQKLGFNKIGERTDLFFKL